MILLRQLAPLANALGPAWLRRCALKRLPMPQFVRRIVYISDTLHARSSEIFHEKKSAVEGCQPHCAKDIITILCE